MKQGDGFIVDLLYNCKFAICVHHFKELIDPQLFMKIEFIRACREYIVQDLLNHEFDVNFIEDEMDMLLRHLPSSKSLVRMT